MLFQYTYLTDKGNEVKGQVEATNRDSAIQLLQQRGIVLTSIKGQNEQKGLSREVNIEFFERVSMREVVILSRQISTLFQAKVPALRIFRLLSEEVNNKKLQRALVDVSNDLQGGATISASLAKHPKIFSEFYINMVVAAEESGKLDETFMYLADYLDRSYELNSKARNALVYPAFVMVTFVSVMTLMLGVVIPKITQIIVDSGQEIPFYTKITIALSDAVVNYGWLVAVVIVISGFLFARYVRTEEGAYNFDAFKLKIPVAGGLYKKIALARIADNMNTMLLSGISMTRSIETTARIVGNKVYERLLDEAVKDVRGGRTVADAMANTKGAVPGVMVQMIKIGEETGELGNILKTLSKFYQREVNNAVDTLVGLIEPMMIILLGVGVGFLLTSVLMPIYNISSGF